MGDRVYLRVVSCAHLLRELDQASSVCRIVRASGRGFDQSGALQRFASQPRNASFKFFCELVLPPAKLIGPGFDGIFVNGILIKRANTAPTIIIDMDHGTFV